jgi:hypothetical protein
MGASPAMQAFVGKVSGGAAPVAPSGASTAAPGVSPGMASFVSANAPQAPAPAASPQAAAPAKSGGLLSTIFGGVANAAKSVFAGAVGGAEDVGKALYRAGAYEVQHPVAGILGNVQPGGVFVSQLGKTNTGKAVVAGYKQTGNELIHPSEIARNYSANPASAAINDISNLLPLAKPLKLASIGAKLGEAADAGKLGATAANAMPGVRTAVDAATHPIRYVGEKAKAGAMADYGAGAGTNSAAVGSRSILARFASAPAATKNIVLGFKAEKGITQEDTTHLVAHAVTEAGIKDPAEAEAFHVVHEGVAPQLATAAEHGGAAGGVMTPEELHAYVTEHFGDSLSTEGAAKAIAVYKGLDAPAADRINKAMEVMDQGLGRAGRGSLAASNQAFLAEHPWQAGYQPNPEVMDKFDSLANRTLNKATKIADAKRARADGDAALLSRARSEVAPAADLRTDHAYANLPPELADAKNSVGRQDVAARQGNLLGHIEARHAASEADAVRAEKRVAVLQGKFEAGRSRREYDLQNAPAHLRPAIQSARDVEKHLIGVANELHGKGLHEAAARVEAEAASMPTTLEKAQAQALEPHYFPHRQEGAIGAGAGGRRMRAGSEKLRKGSQSYDRSFGAIARGLNETSTARLNREMADAIVKSPDTEVAYLGKGKLADARTAADAKKMGYVPFKPGTLFGTDGKVRPLTDLEANLGIEHETPFVPKPVLDHFRDYTDPIKGATGRIVTGLPNRIWVMGRLVATPALETGRILGHTMLRSVRENPVEIARSTRMAYRMWKDSAEGGAPRREALLGKSGERAFNVPPVMLKGGSAASEMDRLSAERTASENLTGIKGGLAKVYRGASKVSEKPLQVAHWWDDLNRSAQFLTEYHRLIENGADVSTSAAAKDVADKAATTALRVVGRFDNLPPAARDYARQVVPFAAWHIALTRIIAQLAHDDPLKVAWGLHLGDISAQRQTAEGIPAYNQGDISVGHSLVNPSLAFPFSEAGSLFGGGFAGIGKTLGPEPRLALGNLPGHGMNPSTGNPWYMPPGTPKGRGPSLLTQAENWFPQTRLLRGLLGQDHHQTYADNNPVLPKANGYQPLPTGNDPTQALLGFGGINVANKDVITQQGKQSGAAATKTAKSLNKTGVDYRLHLNAARRAGRLK